MKPFVRTLLRMAVYQLKFMEKSPHAVVDETVKLIKKRKLTGLAPFVNGVLRSILRQPEVFQIEEKSNAKRISVEFSHPEWAVKQWIKEYGVKFTESLCEKNNTPPEITAVINTLLCKKEDFEKEMKNLGVLVKDSEYFPNMVRLSKTSDISKMPAFKKGLFHIMDESSAAAVFALDPKPCDEVLDICAAPGGKSMLMAELMGNKGKITSRDISDFKLEMLEDTAERLGISIINAEEKDALKKYDEDIEKYDKVLVDAPCSGLGLLRKKPDIRRKKSEEDIKALSEIQRKILENASCYVKKGGVLIYSTCTLTKEENRENFLWFIENFDFETIDLNEKLPAPLCGKSGKYGYAELFPNVHGTDGFFVSAARRKD